MGMFVVLKKSRLEKVSDGDRGPLTLHENVIDAVSEANERSLKCYSETYFIGEIEIVGEVKNAQPSAIDDPADEFDAAKRQFPAFNVY